MTSFSYVLGKERTLFQLEIHGLKPFVAEFLLTASV